ncbi:hypothetical protein [Nonomuraea sp. NPDC003804]|uniref:hypothetical protein n=1 Tax=Nonomuraea sp. NPDC003804 TaxID=3154547 RepID=UPI0033A6E340
MSTIAFIALIRLFARDETSTVRGTGRRAAHADLSRVQDGSLPAVTQVSDHLGQRGESVAGGDAASALGKQRADLPDGANDTASTSTGNPVTRLLFTTIERLTILATRSSTITYAAGHG